MQIKMSIRYIVLLWMVFMSAQALDMRCGVQIIMPGDSESKLREVCGEPNSIEHLKTKIHEGHVYEDHSHWEDTTTTKWSAVWYYNRSLADGLSDGITGFSNGLNDSVYAVTVEDGFIKAIDKNGHSG